MKGISLYSVTPMRAEAREGAEQITQILFGETFSILEQKPRWNRVQLDSDGQEGWIDAKMSTQMSPAEEKAYKRQYKSAAIIAFPMAYAVSENNGQTIPLSAGTRLTNYKDGVFEVLGVRFRIDPNMVITESREQNQENLLQTVRFFLNIPYLWGGKNAMGMDCSGFTQVIMSLFGYRFLKTILNNFIKFCSNIRPKMNITAVNIKRIQTEWRLSMPTEMKSALFLKPQPLLIPQGLCVNC